LKKGADCVISVIPVTGISPDSLDAEQRDAVDGALWSAVRVLEEHAELKLRLARRAAAGGLPTVSEGFEEGARDAHQQAQNIRRLLFAAGPEVDTAGAESVSQGAAHPAGRVSSAAASNGARVTSAGRRAPPRRRKR
jgi:hypothetical protein